jgi:hypothetical protein
LPFVEILAEPKQPIAEQIVEIRAEPNPFVEIVAG